VNKNCPVCSTLFNVGPREVGKQFNCFKCGTALAVTADGIQLAGAASAAPPPSGPMPAVPLTSEPSPALARVSKPTGDSWWRRYDGPTWLFGLGAFFVILFLFLPLINQSKARRAKGALDLGAQRERRQEEEFKKTKDPNPADRAKRDLARDAWAKEAARLEAERSDVEAEAAMSDYWYTWGMMIGFMFLAGAALGYLDPAQPTIRRVVGAIVLVAEVLLIFLRYILSPSRF
jgi:hypothetical protein